ncbi:MAG: ABC transporter ATP-binding protein, partial [Chloroflexi bacterium]|nr:ABC transporter ATP-binding protein [Chloroflexota bacterium]
ESGSGKSTVARMLARLYPPTSGQILFHGKDVAEDTGRDAVQKYRAQVQMIFQDPFGSLNPVKRIEHMIARPLIIHNTVPKDQVRDRVREILTMVGLVPADEVARKYPYQLSGGQRQRVNIARALAPEPEVLLADEPISMLDVSIRMGILNVMLDLKNNENIAFLYITHDIASARYVADEVIVMYAGQVVEKGETDAVLQSPLHPYTRMLLAAVPNPAKGLIASRIETSGEARAAIDPPDACRFVSRCPVAVKGKSDCRNPKLVEVEPNHWVRCFLYPGQ